VRVRRGAVVVELEVEVEEVVEEWVRRSLVVRFFALGIFFFFFGVTFFFFFSCAGKTWFFFG
jgi:hypothetical protein